MSDRPSMTLDSPSATAGYPVSLQRLLIDARDSIPRSLSRRERLAEAAVGGSFAVAAVALAVLVPTDRPLDWEVALLATLVLSICSRVVFEVGSCYTMPTQVAFVPMLFVLPPELVPLFVCSGLAVGKLSEVATGGLAPVRVLKAAGDSWFAIGPAALLALAGAPEPSGSDWPLYVAALSSQFGLESAASYVRERLKGGASLATQLTESRWVYATDALLAPVGLAVAFAAARQPWIVALVAPLALLFGIFARERLARLESLIELSGAYRGTAYMLGDVLQHGDGYTGEHSRSVVRLAVVVAERLGLDEATRHRVELGALLHDLGKIAIPKEILGKPAPLDAKEWTVVKTHTVEGQRMLDKIGGLMRSVGVVVRHSHERFDGEGYPDGLAGEEIPIESRIVFCCDAFSAMTTDRPYRQARPVDTALAELKANAGTQFDPVVVSLVAEAHKATAWSEVETSSDGSG